VLGARWLWVATSVGAGYAAKVTCSLVENSGQDAERVLREHVRPEVAPLGGPVLSVAKTARGFEARILGLVRARAVHRAGLGCTLVSRAGESRLEGFLEPRRALDPRVAWPLGGAGPAARAAPAVEAAVARAFAEPDPPEPGRVRATKAVVVAHDGRLLAERYAEGYGPETPMVSWSMAKSVLAALTGIAVTEGRIALAEAAPVPEWSRDARRAITLDQLLRMSSGLRFDERHRATSDVSRMLFTRPDTGAFAARSALEAPPDTVWHYSSGTSNLVARILRDRVGTDLAARVRWSRQRLFDPAGMTSAFLEPDASGSFVGSSFAFMTARDWARFGELHRHDGEWGGRRILPGGWVRYVTTPTPAAPERRYGAHWWLNAGDASDPARRMWPSVPADAYAARGHSGQYVVVVPSARLVVVRLGLSLPDDGNDGAERLVADLVRALGEPQAGSGPDGGTHGRPLRLGAVGSGPDRGSPRESL
jgi:CubicO group peptidase (beta-lactamase class C family)